jgi:hypothetical protein
VPQNVYGLAFAIKYRNSNGIVTQQRQIIDGQGKAGFLKQLANGNVDWLFFRQNRTDMN